MIRIKRSACPSVRVLRETPIIKEGSTKVMAGMKKVIPHKEQVFLIERDIFHEEVILLFWVVSCS